MSSERDSLLYALSSLLDARPGSEGDYEARVRARSIIDRMSRKCVDCGGAEWIGLNFWGRCLACQTAKDERLADAMEQAALDRQACLDMVDPLSGRNRS